MSEDKRATLPSRPGVVVRSDADSRRAADQSGGVEVKTDGTISIKTGTIITIIAAVLGTGGGTTLMSVLNQPNTEVVERLDAIEARQAESERLQAQQVRLTSIIYRSIIRAHPDAAIPLEDLGLDKP